MMDAVEFLKENERMCKKTDLCADCPAYKENNGHDVTCEEFMGKYPEGYVSCVEKWSAEHPVKTRQSEFLKMFPNVDINLDGVIDIDPCLVDKKNGHCYCEKHDSCEKCYKEYWLEEID